MKTIFLSFLLLAGCHSTASAPQGEPAGAAMQLVPLKYAAAPEVASALNDRLAAWGHSVVPAAVGSAGDSQPSGPRVLVDSRTNSVLIVAPAEDMPALLDLVARLDVQAD